MKINTLAKNRVVLQHAGQELRIEVSDRERGFRLYFSPDARLRMPRNLVIGKRKMVIA